MTRVVSVLEVQDPSLWAELDARVPLKEHLAEDLSPTRRVVLPSFEGLLPTFAKQGATILVRYARRDVEQLAASQAELSSKLATLRVETTRVLHAAQRHAIDDIVIGMHAYDPLHAARSVRALQSLGLLEALPGEGAPEGRFRLHPDLPPPPEQVYDLAEAVMKETDDLSEAQPGSISLLGDLAALAAALQRVHPRRTATGTITRTDGKKLGRQLGVATLAKTGTLTDHPRWMRAMRALEALHAVSTDPLTREIFLDLGLEYTLRGTAEEAVDRFLHRVLDRDLHVIVPAVRSALAAAGPGAIDEMVFAEELRDQHRDLVFPRWVRDGMPQYPGAEGSPARPWDDDGWDAVEVRMIGAALKRLQTLGLVRRAPGVFAATEEGRRWAGVATHPAPPIWISSDLEITIPPGALTPWERFQVERLGRCIARDVVDRYRLERAAVEAWLATHTLDEAIELLERRCPALPSTVRTILTTWAQSATRFVLTRGVLLP